MRLSKRGPLHHSKQCGIQNFRHNINNSTVDLNIIIGYIDISQLPVEFSRMPWCVAIFPPFVPIIWSLSVGDVWIVHLVMPACHTHERMMNITCWISML